ncbi:MAG: hypothetical protein ABIF89_01820 [bacterium]
MISKKTSVVLIVSMAVLSVGLAGIVYSQNNANQNGNTERFCERIGEIYSRAEQRIVSLESKLTEKRNEQQERLRLRREQRNENKEQNRFLWDQNRQEHIAKLEEKAQTDEQKAAVIVFKQAVEIAIYARRTAVDVAQDIFHQGLDDLIVTRKQEADNLALRYREEVRNALQEGQSDCTQGESPKTIRERNRTRLQAARQEYHDNAQVITGMGSQVGTLIEIRNAAVKTAHDNFKEALAEAIADLKLVLGPSEEPEASE